MATSNGSRVRPCVLPKLNTQQTSWEFPSGAAAAPAAAPTFVAAPTVVQAVPVIAQAPVVTYVTAAPSTYFDSHLTISILVALFCFFPVGVYTIYLSLQAQKAHDMHLTTKAPEDLARARSQANTANTCNIVGAVLGICFWIALPIILCVVATTAAVGAVAGGVNAYSSTCTVLNCQTCVQNNWVSQCETCESGYTLSATGFNCE